MAIGKVILSNPCSDINPVERGRRRRSMYRSRRGDLDERVETVDITYNSQGNNEKENKIYLYLNCCFFIYQCSICLCLRAGISRYGSQWILPISLRRKGNVAIFAAANGRPDHHYQSGRW